MPDPKVRTRSSNQKFPSIDNLTITVYFTPNKSLFATLFIFMLNMGHFCDPVPLEHPIFYHIPHEFFAVFLPSKRGDNLLWLSPLSIIYSPVPCRPTGWLDHLRANAKPTVTAAKTAHVSLCLSSLARVRFSSLAYAAKD